MALTPEQIEAIDSKIWSQTVDRGKAMGDYVHKFASAIEAEVRKDDEALIRQLVVALETTGENDGYNGRTQFYDEKAVEEAIAIGRARLEKAP